MTATVVSVFVVAVMMIVAGISEVISAFQVKTWGRLVLWMLVGILYVIAGVDALESGPLG